jgi:hypothetical protein
MTMKRCCTNWTSFQEVPCRYRDPCLIILNDRRINRRPQASRTNTNAQFEQIQQDWKKHCALVFVLIQQIERTF